MDNKMHPITDQYNPIDCIGGQWGFWDETWSDWHGPYENELAARQALKDYCTFVLGD